MSNSRLLNSDKTESIGTTIGFRFHANDEELEELSAPGAMDIRNCEENVKPTAHNSTPEILDGAQVLVDNSGAVSEAVKEHRNFLGKRSVSVDSAYESPFSNPIETWKKLNVLKEKITKTVEEKIFEMKIDRNVLSKSSRNTLGHSKDNSSISDSEDTSESSKMSDHWRSSENQVLGSNKTSNENLEVQCNTSDPPMQDVKFVNFVKLETESKECENELRNRKSFTNFAELINLPDIKIATAKSDAEGSLFDVSLTEEIESGVEADENLDTAEESLDFDELTLIPGGGGSNPPFGGNVLDFLKSVIISQSSTIVFIFGFTLYFFFPLSEFIRGFLLSFLLIIFWGTVKTYMQMDDATQQQGPFIIPNYKSMPPLKVPQSKTIKGIWFNEYEQEVYDPDFYSVSQTVPAYLELEDNILKVSRPKGKIRRRATYDEPEYKLPIISQRIFNVSGCNVYLMPDGLTRKRLFSKKYPIVIFLRPDSLISEKKSGKEPCEKGVQDAEAEDPSALVNPESPKNKCTLYLFARCDRQKEEWYRKLLSATRYCQKNENEAPEDRNKEGEKTPLDDSPNKEPCTPFENLFFDDDVAVIEDYMHYMAKFVHLEMIHPDVEVSRFPVFRKHKIKKKDASGKEDILERPGMKIINPISLNKKSKSGRNSLNYEGNEEMENDSSSSNQVQWFNAFMNRILFDVFRSSYWHSKIQEKVHRKLNSIRLPYYIEDIEVIELDLGKTGPMFHRVSQPYMDERGLWFDMDLTFDGLIRLTIQTHLNLIKLQKGMEETEEMAAQASEKQSKGNKNQRIEKETKDSFLIRESKEKSTVTVNRKSKTLVKASTTTPDVEVDKRVSDHPQLNDDQNLESPPSRGYRSELFDEVAKFAEIAVEESLPKAHIKEKESKITIADVPRSEPSKERSPIYDSELEDSAESSDEEEEEDEAQHTEPPPVTEEPPSTPACRRYPKTRRSSKKIFKVFENVAQSKYFRSVAQSKYIQKAIAGVSAAKLRLTLEIKSCTGILTINIPPPPSDRFWYGFREMPELVFSANPKIGDKAVRFVHIRNYLQRKILHELKKVMVLPNMIDFVLPTSAPVRSSSFLHIEEPDLQEATFSE